MKHTEHDYITAGRRLEKATSPHAFAAQAQAIRAMLEQLGATVHDVTEPFAPAHGAYHSHDH